jgi:hypothetical protein
MIQNLENNKHHCPQEIESLQNWAPVKKLLYLEKCRETLMLASIEPYLHNLKNMIHCERKGEEQV